MFGQANERHGGLADRTRASDGTNAAMGVRIAVEITASVFNSIAWKSPGSVVASLGDEGVFAAFANTEHTGAIHTIER
jgi:hypothetical protein